MTLRLRLLLLISGLLVALAGGAWWGVASLTAELSTELGEAAFSVGRSLVAVFASGEGDAGDPPDVEHLSAEVQETLGRMDAEGARAPVRTWHWQSKVGTPAASDGDESRQVAPAQQRHVTRHVVVERIRGDEHPATPPGPLALRLETTGEEARIRVLTDDHVVREIEIPRSGVEQALERFSRRLVIGGAVLLALALLAAMLVVHRTTAPLARLAEAAREVGSGTLGARVGSVRGAGSEVVAAIDAFDAMSARLVELDAQTRALRDREHLGELGEVARGIAHSLRNPLNALGLSVDRMSRPGSDEDAAELARAARAQIRRLDSSIRSFLALAADRGAERGVVDLGRLCRDVALEATQDAAGRVEIEVEVGEPPPRVAEAVPAELRAVIQALVVNAVEGSPDGARVEVRAEREGPKIRVAVADRGAGIDPAIRERLFAPHVTTKPTGSGMGLFIARRIVATRYGGTLELGDREGGGTMAMVTLDGGVDV